MARLSESKWFRRVCLAALVLLSAWLGALNALNAGEVWVGRNVWHLPLDTWGQLIALAAITALAAYQLARNHRWWL